MFKSLGVRITFQNYNPGDVICRQGDPIDKLYIIFSGCLSVVQNGSVVAKCVGGEVVGKAYFDKNAKRSATLIAVEPIDMLEIPKEDFMTCLEKLTTQEQAQNMEMIQASSFFSQFREVVLKEMIHFSRVKFIHAGEVIYDRDQASEVFCIIKNGSVRREIFMEFDRANVWPTVPEQY